MFTTFTDWGVGHENSNSTLWCVKVLWNSMLMSYIFLGTHPYPFVHMDSWARGFHRIESLGPSCRAHNTNTSTQSRIWASNRSCGAERIWLSIVDSMWLLNTKSYIWRRTAAMLLAYMLPLNIYIYHLANWYKHAVDWHQSSDFIFKSTDLDNTRISSHTFWKTSLLSTYFRCADH